MLEREDEEGARQEGVTPKVYGHDPIRPILHEVGKIQVRYAEAQAFIVAPRPESNALAHPLVV